MSTNKPSFAEVEHVGMVVKDIEKATKFYEDLGMGPFTAMGGRGTPTDRRMYGKPVRDVRNIMKKAPLGPIWLEIVQPVEGESVHMQSLKTRGEGITHLAFIVNDIEKETASMIDKGFQVVSSMRYVEGGGIAHFDIAEAGGVNIELIQPPPGKPE